MEDLSKRMKIQRSFNENSMAPLQGSGLKRSGGYKFPTGLKTNSDPNVIMPSPNDVPDSGIGPIATALLPVVSSLATQAAPEIWKGIKSIGKWFGKLFRRKRGRGLLQSGAGLLRSGGMRDPREEMFLTDSDYLNAPYHDGIKTHGDSADLAEPGKYGRSLKKYKRAMKQAKKLEGGLVMEDIPAILALLRKPGFMDSFKGLKKKPHKILNIITRAIKAAKNQKPL